MVLSDHTIKEELANGGIVVDPLGEGSVQPASVDVHLDRKLRVFRNSRRYFFIRFFVTKPSGAVASVSSMTLMKPMSFSSCAKSSAS